VSQDFLNDRLKLRKETLIRTFRGNMLDYISKNRVDFSRLTQKREKKINVLRIDTEKEKKNKMEKKKGGRCKQSYA
jgi:hypothetical protein